MAEKTASRGLMSARSSRVRLSLITLITVPYQVTMQLLIEITCSLPD
jgi:hypothetical protein